MKKANFQLKKLGGLFIIAGTIFLIYGAALFSLGAPLHAQAEYLSVYLLNVILFRLDSIWFIVGGIFLLCCGIGVFKEKIRFIGIISFGYHLFLFSVVCLMTSYLFNLLTNPHVQSTGRVSTFLLQAISRLISPSFSFDFFVPLGGLVSFAVLSLWSRRVLLKNINK